MRDVLWMQCASFVVIFLLQISITKGAGSSQPTLILVDPFTEYISGHLKQYCSAHNPPIRVVELASAYTTRALNSQGMQIPMNFKIPDNNDDLETWAVNEEISLDPNDTYVLSESDCGAEDAERIATALRLVGNGPSPHLRNKYLANERLRSQGIPVVQQVLANSWEEAEDFLLNNLWTQSSQQQQQQQQCVIKPYRGLNTLSQHISHTHSYCVSHLLSTHTLNPPSQPTLSTHPLNPHSQPTLSTHTLNPPSQHALSAHPLNTPSQHTLSTHTLNPPSQPTHSTHPHKPPSRCCL